MSTHRHTRLCIATLTATLLAGGLAACSKTPDAQALVVEAGEYIGKGDTKAAIIQLKNALQKNPEDREARLMLGMAYLDVNDPQSAEKEVRRAIDLGASADKALPALARALLMRGQFQKVLDETKPAAETTPTADMLIARGNAWLGLHKAEEAKGAFESVLKENADHPDALVGLAKHAILVKDHEAANRYSEQAVSKNPSHADAWYFRGEFLRAQAKTEQALAAYDEVLKVKPRHVSALVAKATMEIGAGKYDAARASLEATRKAGARTLGGLYAQALLDYKQGKHAAALDSLQHVLRAAPGHMQAQLLAGAVQYELGATQQAEVHLKTYLENNPRDLYARKLLAATLLKNGDPKHALAIASAAAKEAPQDAHLLALAGASSLEAKDFSSATDYFQKASAAAPQDAMIRTALGRSKLGQGDASGAMAELEKAIALDKTSAQANNALIQTYVRQKQYDKALALVAGLEKEQPKNPQLQHTKGGIFVAKKDLQSARKSYEQALAHDPAYFPAVASLAGLDIMEKKPDAARKRFESLLEIDKKNTQAMIALGNLALSQKQNDEATRWFERAHAENSDATGPAVQLAMHYLRIGQKPKALTLARKLQASNPTSPEALELLAQMQFANDDKSAALESYEKLTSLKPSSTAVYLRISSVHLAMQNLAGAADALKKALALQPDYLEAQVALAGVEQSRGNHEQALAIARSIQKAREKSPSGHALEAELLLTQKKPEAAVKAFERAYALGKASPLAIKLHAALRQAGREKDADAHMTQWLKEHPSDVSARAYLAGLHLEGGQYKQAINHYESLLRLVPKDVRIMNNLAWAYQQEKDARALPMAEKAYEADPGSAAVLDTLGWILVERGELARGVDLLQKAASLAPDAPDIRYHLALGLVKSGDKEKARGELQRLLASGKDFAKANEARALLAQL